VPPSFSGGNKTKEDNLSGKVSLQWDFASDAMWFASYAEGYKSPAFDLIFGTDANRMDPIAPETSEAWETGIKSELFDRRLRVSLTAFHTNFKDLQGQGTVPDQIGFFLTSAGSAVTQGLEFDFTARPTANLLLNGGVAYIDATFDDFPASQCYSGQTEAQGCIDGLQDLSGKDIPNSPGLKASIQARYDIPLQGPVDMYAAGTYRWQDGSPGDQNQDPELDRKSYGIFDLTIGMDSKDSVWSAQLYAKNLFDNFYQDQRVRNGITNSFSHFLTRDSSRYIGLEVTYRFGAL
jgi:iron complex outermembrane receptor protein